jgi:hypothetical protein
MQQIFRHSKLVYVQLWYFYKKYKIEIELAPFANNCIPCHKLNECESDCWSKTISKQQHEMPFIQKQILIFILIHGIQN